VKLGKYIVIEGHDGTGKSTQVGLIRQKLLENGIDSIEFHEPAGSPISDAIRNVIKDGSLGRDAVTNMLLFSAARHDIWERFAKPAIKSGKWVVASRNYYSTIAYQGYGEGLDIKLIELITRKSTDKKYMTPDIAIILSLDDIKERIYRIGARGELQGPDTFESKDEIFQSKVQKGYKNIAESYKIPVISANNTIDGVFKDIWVHINRIIHN